MLCAYLSLLYGKRFDITAPSSRAASSTFPISRPTKSFCNPALPQNAHRPRAIRHAAGADGGSTAVSARLGEVARSKPAFRGAYKVHRRALQAAEHDIEVAYLHLIMAGEILSSAVELPRSVGGADPRYPPAWKRENCNGVHAARTVRSKLRSVKRRFVTAIRTPSSIQPFSTGLRPRTNLRGDRAVELREGSWSRLRPAEPVRPHGAVVRRVDRSARCGQQ